MGLKCPTTKEERSLGMVDWLFMICTLNVILEIKPCGLGPRIRDVCGGILIQNRNQNHLLCAIVFDCMVYPDPKFTYLSSFLTMSPHFCYWGNWDLLQKLLVSMQDCQKIRTKKIVSSPPPS